MGVGVAMADRANVVALGDALHKAVDEVRADLPLGIDVAQIADQPAVVTESFHEFIKAFVEALVIVLIVSFLTLGLRTGIVVALSVPIVLAIVFVIMQMMGLNFDRITLGALIIALGLLVDDAIIAIEMMVVRIEQGFDRTAAATAAWESTAFPMLTGTLVTAAGFLPVGFAQSTAGEYAGNIFWVVGIALVVSWFVAVIVTPYLGYTLLPEPRPGRAHDRNHGYDGRLYRALRAGVTRAVRARWTVIALTLGAFAAAVVGMGFVQQQFFPSASRPELFIETRMPEGTGIEATTRAAMKAEALLDGDPDVVDPHNVCRSRFAAILPVVEPGPAEPEFRFHRDNDKIRRGARTGQGATPSGHRGRCRARSTPAHRPVEFRASRGFPRPVPRDRTRSVEGARDRG